MASNFNWIEIEKDFSSGLSSADIVRKHGISKGYLSKVIKNKGWIIDKETVTNLPSQFINSLARSEFEKLKESLGNKITIVDEPILIILANQYALYLELQDTVKKEGIVLYNDKGRASFINPNQNALQSVIKTIATISKEFGLTLASRKRQKITLEKEEEEETIFNLATTLSNTDDIDW